MMSLPDATVRVILEAVGIGVDIVCEAERH